MRVKYDGEVLEVIDNPPDRWLDDPLIDRVWLVKENQLAYVIFPLVDTGGVLKVLEFIVLDSLKKWYTSAHGRGFDGSRILLPVKGKIFAVPNKQLEYLRHKMLEIKIVSDRLKIREKYLANLATIQDIIE